MDELSYWDAVGQGIDVISYRKPVLGIGVYPGLLDALVWSKPNSKHRALFALVTLDDGAKIVVIGHHRQSRKDLPPYLGLRNIKPGEGVNLVIDTGLQGALRLALIRISGGE